MVSVKYIVAFPIVYENKSFDVGIRFITLNIDSVQALEVVIRWASRDTKKCRHC